ncbi:TPA: helix-turn-helix transcriptional regulator [Escherichia coli]|uniref:helix-turn-helix transcriptional regulator n=1 Tax=Shigella boydii TaxID=621 RepID=UPI0006662F5D|nr:AlpA family phage regulatory protein [Shigella boydii]EFN5793284.1 AlpA family phage regulatory protein [Escherichia coli]HAW7691023.1 AlpA family phage regulatory protein [Escherichia coli]HEA6948038.1 AlpA family phage regulatory protein [Escherichia coli]
MQNDYNDLKTIAEMMYPNPAVEELKAIADKMCLSERLVDMNQVMEITTLSRRTLLNLEASGEFPERVQVTEGRKAWYLSEVIDWINNIPRASEYCRVPVPKKPDAALCLKIERVRRNARDGRYKLIG